MEVEVKTEQNKLFDSLVHVRKDGKWYDTEHDASLTRLIENLELPISKALVVGMPFDDKNHIIDACSVCPDALIPIAPTNFNNESSFDEIKSDIYESYKLGFRGIKIHPRFLGINLNSKKITYAINEAHKLNMVSLLCTVHKYPAKPLGRPIYDAIHDICEHTSGAKIILLHGGDFELLATSEIVRPYPNVIVDLSSTLLRYRGTSIESDIKYLFRTFDRRISIGSDFPEKTPDQLLSVVNDIFYEIKLEKDKMDNILFKNLEHFFG